MTQFCYLFIRTVNFDVEGGQIKLPRPPSPTQYSIVWVDSRPFITIEPQKNHSVSMWWKSWANRSRKEHAVASFSTIPANLGCRQASLEKPITPLWTRDSGSILILSSLGFWLVVVYCLRSTFHIWSCSNVAPPMHRRSTIVGTSWNSNKSCCRHWYSNSCRKIALLQAGLSRIQTFD